MRITTSPVRLASFTSLLVLGALAAPAHAEHKAAGTPRDRIAAAAADSVRTERGGTSLTTGQLDLTGVRAARRGTTLEANEVAAEVRPYAPDIERCYLDRLGDIHRAGRLDLMFVIGRDGRVVSLDAAAPGLPARTVRQMAICIRDAVDVIHFPERRADTTAIVPYYFQHTSTPGGGPQPSCWDPKGCH